MRLLISMCLLSAIAGAASAPGITKQQFKDIQRQETEKLAAAISAMQKLRDCFAASHDIEEMRRCGSAYASDKKAVSVFASFCSSLPGASQTCRTGAAAYPGNPWMPGGANLPPQNSGDFKGHP
ncbi:MAG: hypothetical protein PHP45_03630 [Elusimicrobiales bacterium]|nr:hypothetical protein [Elusimicrobiales bacterium]